MEPSDSKAASRLQAAQLAAIKRPSEKVGELPSGQRLWRANYTLGTGKAAIPPATATRKTSVTLLVSGTIVSILGSLAISLLHQQLGISSVVAARIAAMMVAASVIALFLGLYVILVWTARPISRQPSLSELHLGDYRVRFKHHASIGRIIRLLFHLAWLAFVAGIVLAFISQTTAARLGSLASGAAVSALALFIRSTVMPMYRLADQSSKQAKRDYGLARRREAQPADQEKVARQIDGRSQSNPSEGDEKD